MPISQNFLRHPIPKIIFIEGTHSGLHESPIISKKVITFQKVLHGARVFWSGYEHIGAPMLDYPLVTINTCPNDTNQGQYDIKCVVWVIF